MAAETDPLEWCCRMCQRPVIDRDPYALDREISPFATIGTLMGNAPPPPVWRPLARRRWLHRLEDRIRRELEKQHRFDVRIREAIQLGAVVEEGS